MEFFLLKNISLEPIVSLNKFISILCSLSYYVWNNDYCNQRAIRIKHFNGKIVINPISYFCTLYIHMIVHCAIITQHDIFRVGRVFVHIDFMFVNAVTEQKLLLLWGNVLIFLLSIQPQKLHLKWDFNYTLILRPYPSLWSIVDFIHNVLTSL